MGERQQFRGVKSSIHLSRFTPGLMTLNVILLQLWKAVVWFHKDLLDCNRIRTDNKFSIFEPELANSLTFDVPNNLF